MVKQDERWNNRYEEVKSFIETNHRNPSKHYDEERNMHTFVKHTKKQMNQGLLKPERIAPFNELLAKMAEYKRVNQWK